MSSHFLAAQYTFSSAYNERDDLLSHYLSGVHPLDETFQTSKEIHSFFRENNYPAYAQEEGMYEGFLFFFAGDYDRSIEVLEKGLKAIKPKNDTLTFRYVCLIAEVHRENQVFDKAEEFFQLANKLLTPDIEKAMPAEVISFFNNYSILLGNIGDYAAQKHILETSSLQYIKHHLL